MKALSLTVKELRKYRDFNNKSRDLNAFAVMTLEAISDSVETTVKAWEKRDYWIKADKFRIEWGWVDACAAKLHSALITNNWSESIAVREVLSTKTAGIKISPRHRMGTPWLGAWDRIQEKN
jgi:hypothetical protein